MSEFERQGRYDEPEEADRETSEYSDAETPEVTDASARTEDTDASADSVQEESGEGSPPDDGKAEAVRERIVFRMPPLVRTALVLFLITSLSASMIAAVNMLTAGPIAQHTQEAVNNALKTVCPDSEIFEAVADAALTGTSETLYKAVTKDGQSGGYAVLANPVGYGGPITLVVGVDQNGKAAGVSVVSMTETAGLGTQCEKPEYLARFIGKQAGVTIGRGENDVDAITGATVSSRAVTQGVSDALATVAAYMAAGEGGQIS